MKGFQLKFFCLILLDIVLFDSRVVGVGLGLTLGVGGATDS